MTDEQQKEEPNVRGLHLSGSLGWHRHLITGEDTMARLALKYNTSIGLICRANRMHCQDVLQTRHHIWVPLPKAQSQIFQVQEPKQSGKEEDKALFSPSASSSSKYWRHFSPLRFLLPHFQRETSPNRNYFADESEPLLIV